jgi:hypothetical protein
VSSFPGSLARMSLVCIGCEIFLLCSACSSSMEDSNTLILPCKRKNKGQGKDKDGKKIKEDPKMSKSKLKKLQNLEVRLPS